MADLCFAANVTTPEVRVVPGMLAYTGELREIFPKLQGFGYNGVEFITTDPDSLDLARLESLLARYGLRPAAVNSGRLCGELGLTLSSPDPEIRAAAEKRTLSLMAFAAHWGIPVNVGILRGSFLQEIPRETTYGWTVEALRRLSVFGAAHGVSLVLETVTASMTNFINNLAQAEQLVRDVGEPALGVMYDVYQMDLEEPDMMESIRRYARLCRHVHLADRDRKVPGDGGMDFPGILEAIRNAGYQGPYSVELAMDPDPETVHRRAAAGLSPLLKG